MQQMRKSAEFVEVTCSDNDERTKMAFYHKVIRNRKECFTGEGISDEKHSAGAFGPSSSSSADTQCVKLLPQELL